MFTVQIVPDIDQLSKFILQVVKMERTESSCCSLKCVVHYPSEAKYSPVVPLNDNTFTRITEAKRLREKFRGKNLHAEQCSTVPTDIQPGVTRSSLCSSLNPKLKKGYKGHN